MSKEKLDLLMAQNTQREIQEIKQGLMSAYRTCEIIDNNMKSMFLSLVADANKMTLRINFLLKILKEQFPDRDIDKEFEVFINEEAPKMQKNISDKVKAAIQKAAEKGNNDNESGC